MYGGEVTPLEAKHTITVLYLHFKSPTVHLADSIYIFLLCFFPPHVQKKLSYALKALLHSARRRLEGGGASRKDCEVASFWLITPSLSPSVLLPGALNSEGGRGRGRGKVAGGNEQKRSRLEVFDKWRKKKPRRQPEEEGESADPAAPSAGSALFPRVWPPRRSPCQSVSHLLSNSLAPPSKFESESVRAADGTRSRANKRSGGSCQRRRSLAKRAQSPKPRRGGPLKSERLPFLSLCLRAGP